MKSLILHLLLAFTFLTCPLVTQAGDVVTNRARYDATLCGDVVANDFGHVVVQPSGLPLSETPTDIPIPFHVGPLAFDTAWGTMTSNGGIENVFVHFTDDNSIEYSGYFWGIRDPSYTDTWTVDANLGPVEGFGITYLATHDITLNIYNGPTLVQTVIAPAGGGVGVNDTSLRAFVGWLNTEGVDVTSVEVVVDYPDVDPMEIGVAFYDVDFSFGIYCPPALETIVDNLVSDLEDLLPSGDPDVDDDIQCAIDNIIDSQNPIYWADADNLSDDGKKYFKFAEKATDCLEDASLGDFQDELHQVVAALAGNAIQAAIDRGGDPKDIAKAIKSEAKAQAAFAAGDYDKAIKHLGKAWKSANKA